MEVYQVLQIILGSIFILFTPGFAWTFIFFGKDEIDAIERIALSFGLSIALVPLMVFYLNFLLGVKITLINSAIAVLSLTLLPSALYYAKKRGLIPGNLSGLKKLWES